VNEKQDLKVQKHEGRTMARLIVLLTPSSKHGAIEYVANETNTLRVHVKAKPIDNEANKELIKVLSKKFDVSKSRIIIRAGNKSRTKRLEITGISQDELAALMIASQDKSYTKSHK
jgi:uncharacterized protein (TIGR00251 family)